MSVNDDYLFGCDVLGAITTRTATVKAAPSTEVAPAATVAARSAAVTPTTVTARSAAVTTPTVTARSAVVAPVTVTARSAAMQEATPTVMTRGAGVKTPGPAVQRSVRPAPVPVVVMTRGVGVKTPTAMTRGAGSIPQTPIESYAQVAQAAQRLIAAGNRLGSVKGSKKRKSLSSMASKLKSIGNKTAAKAAKKTKVLKATSHVMGTLIDQMFDDVLGADRKKPGDPGYVPPPHAPVDLSPFIADPDAPAKLPFTLMRSAAFMADILLCKLTAEAAALVGENGATLTTLVKKLDDATLTSVANDGQAIIDRAQTLIDAIHDIGEDGILSEGAPVADWKLKADAINSDSETWIATATAALNPAAPVTPPPDGGGASGGGGSSGGGGGGGGGGEEGGAGGEEGAPEEGGEEGAPEEGAPEEGGEEGAPPLEEQMYEEAYGRRYGEQPGDVEQPDVEAQLDAAEQPEGEQPAEQSEDVSGDDLPFVIKSELPNVSDAAWTRFALAMKTSAVGAVSDSNSLGMFEMRPRRLADLDLVINLSCTRSKDGRVIWVGEFIPPLSAKLFLTNPEIQYQTFVKSMKNYVDGLRSGSIPKPDGGKPEGVTLSGVLAILHRAGPNGLKNWNDESTRFENTVKLFEKANEIF